MPTSRLLPGVHAVTRHILGLKIVPLEGSTSTTHVHIPIAGGFYCIAAPEKMPRSFFQHVIWMILIISTSCYSYISGHCTFRHLLFGLLKMSNVSNVQSRVWDNDSRENQALGTRLLRCLTIWFVDVCGLLMFIVCLLSLLLNIINIISYVY